MQNIEDMVLHFWFWFCFYIVESLTSNSYAIEYATYFKS